MNRVTRTLFRSLIRWNQNHRQNCFTLHLESEILGLDQAIIDLVPQSLRVMTSEEDMKKLVRHVYRTTPTSVNGVENAFRALRNLNSYASQLKIHYAHHLRNLKPDINEKAIFKIGQVCKHIARGYRGIVVGWEIMSDNTQKVEILVDSVDFNEFTKAYADKTKFVLDDEICLIFDEDLLRIHNDSISSYFNKFDLKLRRYIPVQDLLFRYPCDFDNISKTALDKLMNSLTGKQSNGSANSSNKVKYSESKEILDLQNSHDKVNETIKDLCHHLYSIIQQYDIPMNQSFNNQESSSSSSLTSSTLLSGGSSFTGAEDGTDGDGILNDIYLAINKIEKSFDHSKIVSSPDYVKLYHSFIPLWGPSQTTTTTNNSNNNDNKSTKTHNAKKSLNESMKSSSSVSNIDLNHVKNSSNTNGLSATKYAAYSALGHLGNLYHIVEQILTLRFQRFGVSYIEELLDLHVPVNNNNNHHQHHHHKYNNSIVSNTPKRSYMKGKYTTIRKSAINPDDIDNVTSSSSSGGSDLVVMKSNNESNSVEITEASRNNHDINGHIELNRYDDDNYNNNNNNNNVPITKNPGIIDNTHEPPVLFSVGQVVRHKIFNYRGVIFGWDQRPNQNVAHWEGMVKSKLKSEQPFYKILPDEDDVEAFLGSKQHRDCFYVAQENLELFQYNNNINNSKFKCLQVPIKHRNIQAFFRGFDPITGCFNVPSKLQFFFPKESSSIVVKDDVSSGLTLSSNFTTTMANTTATDGSGRIFMKKSNNHSSSNNLSNVEKILIQMYSVLKNSFSYTREESNNDINVHRSNTNNIMNDPTNGKKSCVIEVCKFPLDRPIVAEVITNNTTTTTTTTATHANEESNGVDSGANTTSMNMVIGHSVKIPNRSINNSSSNYNFPNQAGMYVENFPILNMRDLLLLLKKAENRVDAGNVDSLLRFVFSANRNKEVNKLMRIGTSHLNRGNLFKARQSFLQAVCTDPNFSEAQTLVSAMNSRFDDHLQCIHWSKLAIKQSPRHYHALGALAVSYEKMNRPEEAAKVIRRALTLHPWASHLPTVLQSILVRSSSSPVVETTENSKSSSSIEES